MIALLWLMFSLGPVARAAEALSLLASGPVAAPPGGAVDLLVAGPALVPGARLVAKGPDGKPVPAVIEAPGLARVTVPVAPGGAELRFSLSVKSTGGAAEQAFVHPVLAVAEPAPVLTLDPPRFRAGIDAAVQVRVALPPAAQGAAARRPLVRASAGTLDAFVPVEPGVYVARWVPPAKLDGAQVVVFTAAEANDPLDRRVVGTLPVSAKAKVVEAGPAGARGFLKLGDRVWGPVSPGKDGKFTFDAEVDPLLAAGASVEFLVGEEKSARPVKLPLAPGPSLALAPLPATLPAGAARAVELLVVSLAADGSPGPAPTVTADRGTVGAPQEGGAPGVYRVPWKTGPQAGPATLRVEAGGRTLTEKLTLYAAEPPALALLPEAPAHGGAAFTVRVAQKDARGAAVMAPPPAVLVGGGTLAGKPTDGGDGAFRVGLAPAGGDVVLAARADAPAPAAPGLPARLLVLAEPVEIGPGHGLAVAALVLDAFDHPVPNVELRFSVPVGEGSVAPSARTDAGGLALVRFAAGAAPGVALVQVEGAGLTGGAVVPVGGGRPRPSAGTDADAAALARVAVLSVPREARVVAPPPPVAPVGPVPVAGGGRAPRPSGGGGGGAGGEGAALRASGWLGFVARTWSLEAESGGDTPEEAGYETGALGAPGIGGDLLYRVGSTPFRVDARGFLVHDPFSVDGENQGAPAWEAMVGARYAVPLAGPLHGYGLGQVHVLTPRLLEWTDGARLEVDDARRVRPGLRVGGGLLVEQGRLWAQLELSETLAPLPSNSHIGTALAVTVTDSLAATVGADFDWRRARFGDVDEARVKDASRALRAGVSFVLP